MPQTEYDIFVSYSSKNRKRVMEIVHALEARRVKVWIDRKRIPGGASFNEKIPEAIVASKVVVPMLTAAFNKESAYVAPEINYAFGHNREIVPLKIEDVELDKKFELWLGLKQWIDVLDRPQDEWMNDLVDSLKNFGVSVGDEGGAALDRAQSEDQSSPLPKQMNRELLASFVNREKQTSRLEFVLDQHLNGKKARPIFVLVHGDEEQDVDLYIDRLIIAELGEILHRLKGDNALIHKHIIWPGEPSDADRPDSEVVQEHCQRLKTDVNKVFDLRPSASPCDLLKKIRNRHLPVLLWTKFGTQIWCPAYEKVLEDWVASWGEFPDLPDSQPLLVIIAVWYPHAEKGFFNFLQNREARRRKQDVSLALDKLAGSPVVNLAADKLPELANVIKDQVVTWAEQRVKPKNIKAMRDEIGQLFDSDDLKKNGMPMRPLANKLKELIDKY